MSKTRVGLLYGGKSGEHEVSQRSAASVLARLDPARYEVVLIGIDLDGVWHLQEETSLRSLPGQGDCLEVSRTEPPVAVLPGLGLWRGGGPIPLDIVFPVLHGSFGEDGTVQGLLELAGLPYVGAGVLGSALAMDKEKAKQVWRQAGLPVVDFLTLRDRSPASLRTAAQAFGFPLFVKPAAAGSSVGIHRVERPEELDGALADAFRYSTKVLVEPAVDAREIECAVLGNGEPTAFAPGEVIPRNHAFYDYEAKYLDPDGAALVIPARLDPPAREEVRRLAVEACRAVEVCGMARVDFFLEKRTGRLFLNEINTLPGFTSISMYPKMCEAAGIPYPRLLDRLIELGMESHETRNGILYRFTR